MAACTWNGNTGTVASPYGSTDVADCISDVAGKTGNVVVALPACNVTWNEQVNISTAAWTNVTGFILEGAGTTSGSSLSKITSVVTDGNTINSTLTKDIPFEIKGIYFARATNLSTGVGGYSHLFITGNKTGSFAATQVKIHDNKFEKGSHCLWFSGWFESVAYGNTFLNCNIAIMTSGDTNYAWERWGNNQSAGTIYANIFEENTFVVDNNSDREPNEQIYHQDGGKTVIRYNTFDGSNYTLSNCGSGSSQCFFFPYESHPNWGSNSDLFAYRAQPLTEVYENSVSGRLSQLFSLRGGSLIMHDNTYTRLNSATTPWISLTEEEGWTSGGPFSDPIPKTTTWPAGDQVNNTFFWNNTCNWTGTSCLDGYLTSDIIYLKKTTSDGSGYDDVIIQKDRDYFFHAPCAAADSDDAYGNTCTHGKEIYTNTTATMTYTDNVNNAYYPYIPYTYPHTLRTEAYDTVAPASPTGLSVN